MTAETLQEKSSPEHLSEKDRVTPERERWRVFGKAFRLEWAGNG